jgi:hypothetical protein
MHDAGQHLVLLVFSIGFSAIGWFMAHNPARVYRAFTMDAEISAYCKGPIHGENCKS